MTASAGLVPRHVERRLANFILRRRPPVGPQVRQPHPAGVVPRVLQQRLREGAGLLLHERAVHQVQGLRRDHRAGPLAVGHVRLGEVEHLEEVEHRVPDHRQVDAPAAVVVPGRVGRVLVVHVGEVAVVQERPADPRVERAGHGEEGVADRLGLQPAAVEVPEEPVLRVTARRRRRRSPTSGRPARAG